jgi:hypothetical protein
MNCRSCGPHSGATAIHVAVRTGAESVVSMLAGMLLFFLHDIFKLLWQATHVGGKTGQYSFPLLFEHTFCPCLASTEHGGVTDEGTWATGQCALHDAARLGRIDLLIILIRAHLEQVLLDACS